MCVPFKYLILMPDIKEFTVQIPPHELLGEGGGQHFFCLPPTFISVYALVYKFLLRSTYSENNYFFSFRVQS